MVTIDWPAVKARVAARWPLWLALIIGYLALRALWGIHEDFVAIGIAILQQLAALRAHT